jgi:hypothetical protein
MGRNKLNIMPNTFTQIHIQDVFFVQDRESIILKGWKDEKYKSSTGTPCLRQSSIAT